MHSSAYISNESKKKSVSYLKKNLVLFLFVLLNYVSFGQKNAGADKKAKLLYGTASFYCKSLEGAKTATGEVFHHSGMSAASNLFKLNTWVRITNLQNGKSILVRINDRMSKGMEAIGRVADLTRNAAQQLGFLAKGLTKVRVEAVAGF